MDKAFSEVAADYDRWCRTDIGDADLIDSLIDGNKYLAEQLDEAQQTADLRLAAIHTQSRALTALQARYDALADDIHTLGVITFLAVCAAVATWLRFGLVGQ